MDEEEFSAEDEARTANEQAVLGAAVQSARAAQEVALVLRPEMFARNAHRTVFEAVTRLADDGEPVDPAAVLTELARTGKLGRAAGSGAGSGGAFLHTLMTQAAPNALWHAVKVREAWHRDNLAASLRTGLGILAQPGYDPAVHPDAIRKLVEDATALPGTPALRTSAEILGEVLTRLEEGTTPGLPTGLADLDEVTGGLKPATMTVIAARPGVGKALALDTPIPVPGGWTTMKDIQAGDYVFGMDGKPARVVFATEVMYDHPCYDVEFSDGTVITADAEHLWLTETRASRRAATPPGGYAYRRSSPYSIDQRWKSEKPAVRTTEAIRQTLRVGSDARLNHSVPLAAPLELPEADLPIDPYVLGYWLGDGSKNHAVITVAADDMPSLIDRIDAAGYFHGKPRGSPAAWELRVSTEPVRAAGHYRDSLQGRLRAEGLLRNKHIPSAYLRASEPQRRALLAGLLDSDGTIGTDGRISLDLTSRQLAEQALELIATLGYRPQVNTRRVPGRSEQSSICYRVGFTTADHVFLLPRKDARRPAVTRPTSARRYIVAVRPVKSVPVRCIGVDNDDHMYLAGRTCIPTHNSVLCLQAAELVAGKLGLPVLFSSLEMSAEQLFHRRIAATAKVPLHFLTNPPVPEEGWEHIRRAYAALSASELRVDDTPNAGLAHIRGQLRAMDRAGSPARLLVVDYLGLLAEPARAENRQAAVAANARGLRNIGREFGIPVIAAAQLNRGPEHRSDRRPVLADLRESGEIEAAADVVILLHREDAYERESPRAGEIDLIVQKNRQGPQCTITACFQGHYARIVSMAPAWTPSSAVGGFAA
jgi:replicative DNA helicase